MNYFVIGEREMVLAFRLVGVDGTIAETRQEVLESFNRVTGRGGPVSVPVEKIPRVLILTESAASYIQDEWQKTADYPLIVEIPGLEGHLSGRKTLTEAIGEAIGVKI